MNARTGGDANGRAKAQLVQFGADRQRTQNGASRLIGEIPGKTCRKIVNFF
jgi:hypothetical protein